MIGSNCKGLSSSGKDACAEVNSDWCCLYSSIDDVNDATIKVESWVCSLNPDSIVTVEYTAEEQSILDAAEELANSLNQESYCALGKIFGVGISTLFLSWV